MAYKILGKDHTPPDIEAKVTGRARYAEDFRADGMVFLKLLSSPMPHARVVNIDISKAKKVPGFIAVLEASELKASKGGASHEILSNTPVYVGQPILAVAAETEQAASDAVEAIELDLEPLPFVIDPLDSLKPGGPNAIVGGNVANRRGVDFQEIKWSGKDFALAGDDRLPMGKTPIDWQFGDLEAKFKESALILEESFVSSAHAHHALEPRSAAAYWENGKAHVWGSTQSSSFAVPSLAGYLGMKPQDVVLISEFCGGGFGGKGYSYPLMAIPALMSKKLGGRPVMMRASRAEEYYNGSARAGFQGWVKVGFGSDGRVKAMDAFIVQDNGSTGGFWDFQNFGDASTVVFQPEAMRYRGIPVLTNTPPKGPQRGPGENQTANILEPLMTKAALKLGLDPLQLRMVNSPGGGGEGTKIGAKQTPLTSAYLKDALVQGAKLFNYDERSKNGPQRIGTKIRAIGIGQCYHSAGAKGFDGLVRITTDGILHIHTGVGNLGTYSYMDTSKVAAEILGYDWDRCVIERGGSPSNMPWNLGQFGSNTSFTMTRTNYVAAIAAKDLLLDIASQSLGGSPDDYQLENEFVVAKAGGKSISFADCAKRAIDLGGKYDGHTLDEDLNPMTKASATAVAGTGLVAATKDKLPLVGTVAGLAAAFIEIELDTETGRVEVMDYLGIPDVGTVLHPKGLAAQVRGAAVMGFGAAGTERLVYDPEYGRPGVRGLYQAKPPSYLDVPASIGASYVEGAIDPHNPVGAKGMGEPVMGAASAAYLDAITVALDGHVFNRVPVVADMIINHLNNQPQSNKPLQVNCQ